MSDFGPPPGAPDTDSRRRRPSYLPPGGRGPASGLAAPELRRYAVTRSSRPGIVPLRPLGLADVLDGAVKLVRRNPRTALTASALVNAAASVPAVALVSVSAAGSWMRSTGVATVIDARSWAWLLGVGGTAYAVLVLAGVLAPLVTAALLGHRPGPERVWAAVRPRLWALLGSQALLALALVLPWVVLVGAMAALNRAAVPVILVTGGLLTLLAFVVDLVLLPRLLFTAPTVVVEGLGPIAAMRRSWALSRRRAFDTGGTLLLASIMAVVVFWVLQLPQWLLYNLLVGLFEPSRAVSEIATSFNFTLASLGSAILVTPFLAAVGVLRYVDARMRAEGLDLVLLRAAASEAGVGS